MKIDIEITGTTGLLMNRFSDENAEEASGGSRSSSGARDRGTPHEDAEGRLYRDEEGRVFIPQPNLLRCLVEGGGFHKIGKKQVTTQRSSLMYAAVDIAETAIYLKHPHPWKVDTRPIRIPATGGRILRHRPVFDEWSLAFEADLDLTIINAKLFRLIVDDAGKRIGLGDFRPATKGPYGKFVVTKWIERAEKPVQLAA